MAFGDEHLVEAVLEDVDSAPIPEPLRATLKMLSKLTLEPHAFGPEDVDAVRRHGVGDDAIRDAMCVAAQYNTMDRFADTLAFAVADDWEREARFMLDHGYGAVGDFDKLAGGPPSED